MLGGKLKYILGAIFLLVLLVVAAEAGFYFGATRKEKIIPSISLLGEAPIVSPIIKQLPGFDRLKRGLVKGITIKLEMEGTIKDIEGSDRFYLESRGGVNRIRISEGDPPLILTAIYQPSGTTEPLKWEDLRTGDQARHEVIYDGLTGEVKDLSLTVFRQE